MPFGGLLTAGIGAAGSLFGGLFGSNASGKASQQYIQALQQAQQQLTSTEQQGLQQFQPYTGAGTTALSSLMSSLPSLTAGYTGTFTAPTAAQAEATPGYQFQLQQGEDALQNSSAGKGSLLTGRTGAALNNYAQGVASTNYQNVFNNSLTQYQQAYQQFLNNQNNTYSRLMGLTNTGLGAANSSANLISGIGGDIASLFGQQGAARAAGTTGSANSILGMIPGLTGSLTNFAGSNWLSNLFSPSTSSTGGTVIGQDTYPITGPMPQPQPIMTAANPWNAGSS